MKNRLFAVSASVVAVFGLAVFVVCLMAFQRPQRVQAPLISTTPTSTFADNSLIVAIRLLPSDLNITRVSSASDSPGSRSYIITATKEADTHRGTTTTGATNLSEYQVWYVDADEKIASLLASRIPGYPGTRVSLEYDHGVAVARTHTEYLGHIVYEDFILSGEKVAEAVYTDNGVMNVVINHTTTTIELAPRGICDHTKPGSLAVDVRGLLINGEEYRFPHSRKEYCVNWPFYKNAAYDYQTIANPVFSVDTRWGDQVEIGSAIGSPDEIKFYPAQ